MLDRLREWLSDDSAERVEEESGWRLSMWWGAAIVALFTLLISLCNDPGQEPAIAAPASTTTSQAPLPTEPPAPVGPTLLQVFADRPDLTFFTSMIENAGIQQSLTRDTFTFFAPTDDVFAALDQQTRDLLLSAPESSVASLLEHVTVGSFSIEELASFGVVPVGSLKDLPVTEEGGEFFIAGARVLEPNVVAANGTIHIVDAFLGTGQPDASPPVPPEGVPAADVLEGRDDLSTLVAALGASDGSGLLDSGEEGFTLFAPTNDAFAALPAGSVAVLVETQPKLIELLGYHVVGGRVTSADLADGDVLITSSGAELPVAVNGDTVTVGGVAIAEADIDTADGVVHIVEGVLLPPEFVLPTINEALALEPVTFETGSATITAEGLAVLDNAVAFLAANPDVRVAIEGHTDSSGSESGNQALSEARAVAVRDYLTSQGIDELRLETFGFGESNPVASNDTAEGRAQNRRIEFRLIG